MGSTDCHLFLRTIRYAAQTSVMLASRSWHTRCKLDVVFSGASEVPCSGRIIPLPSIRARLGQQCLGTREIRFRD
jgi:hypothetical protein